MFEKEKASWPGIIQQAVNLILNAGSRRLGVETERAGVDYRSH